MNEIIPTITANELIEAAQKFSLIRDICAHFKIKCNKLRALFNYYNLQYPCYRGKYDFNEDFFSEINENSMYWAGYLATDGLVRRRKSSKNFSYETRLELSIKDKIMLEKLKSDINYTGNIIEVKRKPSKLLLKNKLTKQEYTSCYISLTSRQIFDDLGNNFNIVPRKTFIYSIPDKIINSNLFNHFLRGYFDGDGSVSLNKNKDGQISSIRFSICGACPAVKQIYSFITDKLNLKYGYFTKNSSVFSFGFNSSGDVREIKNYLYKNSNLYLERKFNVINNVDQIINDKDNIIWDPIKLKDDLLKVKNIIKLAKLYNVDRSTIYYNLKKFNIPY